MGSFLPPPPTPSHLEEGGRMCVCVCVCEEGVDFRGYAAFAMQRRVVDASHVEDDGAERLN